ncbi:MAG TPA: Ku protein [Fimbriimonadaceae bacterium]|nr:Ku protein [Fimbriimonadaceae bacterium]
MPRSIWNGVITFGMVSIPVGLTTAVQEKDISFHQLHKTCGSRVKYQKWCPHDEVVVPNDEIVRGYEYSKGSYVLMTEEDFEDVPVPTKHTLEVTAFVKAEEIDPIYYDTTYYLEAEEAGRKPFALLMKAAREKGVLALGKIALRNKESLCVIREGNDGGVMLETLFFPDEIRKPVDQGLGDVKIEEKEMKMASSLIEMLEESFDPSQYKDEYREALMRRIEDKVAGKEVQHAPEAAPAKVVDLMEALKKSLEEAKKKKTG